MALGASGSSRYTGSSSSGRGGTTLTTSSSGRQYGSHGGSFGGSSSGSIGRIDAVTGAPANPPGKANNTPPSYGSNSGGSGSSGGSGGSKGNSGGSSGGSHYDPNYGLGETGMPSGSAGWGGGGGGGGSSTPAQSQTPASSEKVYDLDTKAPKPYELPDLPDPNPERLEHVDTKDMENMLQQISDSQKEQSQNKIDYNVKQGIDNLNRAMEDAAPQYQTERNQIAADEATALDNQALYAEARGDRGGIGEAQYASIQNNAAQNRLSVNQAQTKLATDTARQVEDLRAQGEFQKADELLTITQNYLSQLMDLKQWATETNLSVDEFNSKLQQWVDEFKMSAQQYLTNTELSAAGLTGMFADGTRTNAAQNELINALATSGNALLNAGIMPTQQQLNAMGMTEAQAQLFLARKGF